MNAPEIPIKFTKLFINNEWVDAQSGKTFDTINPANKKVIASVAEADKADVDLAVAAAKKAFEFGSEWRTMDYSTRGQLLNKLADEIEKDIDYLSNLEALDNGKPVMFAKAADLTLTIKCYRYYAGWCGKITGKTIPAEGNFFTYTVHEPIGVIGQIIPWNFPLLMQAWKLAPALCCGNVVVMKPAEQTPLTALAICDLIKKVGFPPGVVNMLPGYGPTAGAAITEHKDVDKVAFTGSTEVGQIIAAAGAKCNLKRVTLELGGKSPAIVFPDCDFDSSVNNCFMGLFFNSGQCCCASSRVYVHEDIYDKFAQAIAEKAKSHKVGDQFTEGVLQGPQVDQEQYDKILHYIKLGKECGATLMAGGACGDKAGFYIQPTVFANCTEDMSIVENEIFGPVITLLKFKDTANVIARANDSDYGLAAAVFSKNIDTINHVTSQLKAGTVWVNCYNNFDNSAPFGGYKMSGYGRDKSEYALENYTEVKCVTTSIIQKNN